MKNPKYNNPILFRLFRHPPIKRGFSTLALVIAAFIATARVASAQTQINLFNHDFESDDGITTGNLNGQSGWTLVSPAYSVSPVVTNGPAGSVNISQVIWGNASGNSGSYNSTLFSADSLDSNTVVTLSVDIYPANNFGTAMFGIGNTPSTYAGHGGSEGPTFGAWTANSHEQLAFYQGLTSTGQPNYASGTPGGTNFVLTLNHWYRIQSVWDLGAGTATLSYEDLTAGDSSFTSLYFGTSTTIALEASGANDPVSSWNSVYLRLSPSGNPEYMDNLQATAVSPVYGLIENLQPTNCTSFATYVSPTTPITFTSQSTNGIDASGIQLILNGVDASGALSITGDDFTKQVQFNGLASNQTYTAVITVTDRQGYSKTDTLQFTTWAAATAAATNGTRDIEVEDYDFNGGQFIDYPILSTQDSPSNYLDQLSVAEVDVHLITLANNNPYRIGDPVGIGYANDFPLRPQYIEAQQTDPGVTDYALTSSTDGQWENYTRTFAPNSYWVYGRFYETSSIPFQMSLSSVNAGNATALGSFVGTGVGAGYGGWGLLPLTDAFGHPVGISLNGVQTLRLGSVSGSSGLNANYMFFVPAASPAPAFVSAIQPASSQIVLATNPIVATIINQGTQVQPNTLNLKINGVDVTAAATLTLTANGLTVTYVPIGGWGTGTQNVVLTFQDNAANVSSNSWSFVAKYFPTNSPGVFQDAVLRVTFAGTADDVSSNASPALVTNNITYTTDLPPMPNSSGSGAVFNGSNSRISYGLGNNDVLQLQTNLTYHIRVKFNTWSSSQEQWLMGRFDSSGRVSFLDVPTGTYFHVLAGVSSTGSSYWTFQYSDNNTGSPQLATGVFYDIFLRVQEPGIQRLDVYNAQTGANVSSMAYTNASNTALFASTAPLEIGDRSFNPTACLNGVVEQVNVWNRALSNSEITNICYYGPTPALAAPSVKSLSVLPGGNVDLRFTSSQNGDTFTVQGTTSLTPPAWTNVSGGTYSILSDGTFRVQFPAPASSTQFYRVVAQ